MTEKEQLQECLGKFNCSKCKFIGRAYGQNKCFFHNKDGRVLLPDIFYPCVCINFELKE